MRKCTQRHGLKGPCTHMYAEPLFPPGTCQVILRMLMCVGGVGSVNASKVLLLLMGSAGAGRFARTALGSRVHGCMLTRVTAADINAQAFVV